jgi:hypothetical protein
LNGNAGGWSEFLCDLVLRLFGRHSPVPNNQVCIFRALQGRPMELERDAKRLRGQATRLLALAIRARENGNVDVGNDLALLASEAFNRADQHND